MADLTTPYAQRLCLSGVESRRLLDTFKEFGVPHIQVSYYYLRRVFSDPSEFEKYSKDFKTVIIDSGTVYGNVKNQHEKDELLQDYQNFLGALDKKAFTAAVAEPALDLEGIIPDEALIYPLDDIRGVFDNDLSALFKNVKYVGVSQKECSAKGGEELAPIFAHANKTGAYIHAFGTSSRRILTKHPFYSANSSSWRSGSRYLNTYIYEGPGRGLRLYQPTDKKDPVKTEKETATIRRRQQNLTKVRQPELYNHVDWGACIDGESWEVDKGNLIQWILYQQDLGLLPHNKYFLTDQQRSDINLRKASLYSVPGINTEPADTEDPIQPEDQAANIGGAIEHDIDGEIIDAHIVEDPNNPPVYEGRSDEPGVNEIPIINPRNTGAPPATGLTPAYNAGQNSVATIRTPRITPIDDRMRQVRQCDFCVLAGRCPKYQPGAPCSYGLPPENPTYDHNDMDQIIREQFADVMAIQMDRVQQLALEERMDASGANKDLTANLKLWAEIISLYREAVSDHDRIKVDARGPNVIEMFTQNKARGH